MLVQIEQFLWKTSKHYCLSLGPYYLEEKHMIIKNLFYSELQF